MSRQARSNNFKKMSRSAKVVRCLHRRSKPWRNVYHRIKFMDRAQVAHRERCFSALRLGIKTCKHAVWWRTKGCHQEDDYDDIRRLVSDTHFRFLPSPRDPIGTSKARDAMARAEAWIAQEKEKARVQRQKENEAHKHRLRRHDLRRTVLIREANRRAGKV